MQKRESYVRQKKQKKKCDDIESVYVSASAADEILSRLQCVNKTINHSSCSFINLNNQEICNGELSSCGINIVAMGQLTAYLYENLQSSELILYVYD